MLAPSAYMASAAGSVPVSSAILPTGMDPTLPSIQVVAMVKWVEVVQHSCDPP